MAVCPLLHDSSDACRNCTGGSNIAPQCPPNPHPSRTQTADESQKLSSCAPFSSPRPPPSTHPNSIPTPNQSLKKDKHLELQSSTTIQPSSVKLTHPGTKIVDKVRAFEERMSNTGKAGVAASSGRAAYFHSNFSGKKPGGPTKEEARILQGVAEKRAAFKQKASSLEDKTSYSQKVQSYQSKFTEELQRIKKLVGKPSLKKAYSTEQLVQKDRLATEKLEPIPPQVVKRLEVREQARQQRNAGELQMSLQGKGLTDQCSRMTQPETQGKPVDSSSQGSTAKSSVTMETAPAQHLPGQPLPTATRTSQSRFGEDLYQWFDMMCFCD